MFKKSPEQHIIIEADKVASMKESLDALSWDRVSEIAKIMQAGPDADRCFELGRELLSIAQANTSLLGKLGVTASSFSGKMMPSGVEMLQNNQAAVTIPSGEAVVLAERASRSIEGYILIAESGNQDVVQTPEQGSDALADEGAVDPDAVSNDVYLALESLKGPAGTGVSDDTDPFPPYDLDLESASIPEHDAAPESDLTATGKLSDQAKKLVPVDSLIPACDEEVARLDFIPSALEPTGGLSDSVRSILFPDEGQSPVLPDLSTVESDFFSAPEPSADTFIPRGDGAAAVTGASGIFIGEEYHEGQTLQGELAPNAVDSSNGSDQAAQTPSVFESVLEFASSPQPAKPEEAQGSQPAEELPVSADQPQAASTGSSEAFSGPVVASLETELLSGNDPNLTLSVLCNEALIAELGISPEMRAELIKEVEAKLASTATAAPVQESIANSQLSDQAEADAGFAAEQEASSASQATPLSEAMQAAIESALDKASSSEPSDNSVQEVDAVIVGVVDDPPGKEGDRPSVFKGKDESIIADLERQAKHAKKLAGFAERKGAEKEPFGMKTKKVNKQELAGFRQIYTSRDGALNLYVDSTGHVVAVDSARLA